MKLDCQSFPIPARASTPSPEPRRWRRRVLAAAAAAASLASATSLATVPTGTTRGWVCGGGDWETASCWSTGVVPTDGDSVVSSRTTANIFMRNQLDIQLDELNLHGFSLILNQTDSVLTSNREYLTTNGSTQATTRHYQRNGLNQTGALLVGASGNGAATYTTDGTATLFVLDTLQLGGSSGGGNFLQLASSQVSASFLEVGAMEQAHPSAYNLQSGTLTTGQVLVGYGLLAGEAGSAVFAQTGGVHTTGTLAIGSTGRYSLQAGRLNLTDYAYSDTGQDGTFEWQGGRLNVVRALDIGDGSLPFNQGPILTLGAGRSLSADTLRVPEGRSLVHAGGSVVVDTGQTFINNGSHDIGSSTFTVSGTATSTGLTTLAGGVVDGSNGSYTNQGVFTGYGRIQGDVTVLNDGLMTVRGGRLQLAGARPMFNTGTLSFANLTDGLDVAPILSGTFAQAGLVNLGLLQLSGQQITGDGLVVNADAGTLSGWGTVRTSFENRGGVVVGAGSLNFTRSFGNFGVVELTSAQSRLAGGGVVNDGTVQGLGTVVAQMNNLRDGTVEARGGTLVLTSYTPVNQGLFSAVTGAKLQLLGGLGRNDGRIMLAGGTVVVAGGMTNLGAISGYGSLQADSIVNNGSMQFTGGTVLLSAGSGVFNRSSGQIIVSGNANLSVFGAVTLGSGTELRVSDGAVATFFDTVQSEPGALFTGTGLKHYEGGFSSAAAVVVVRDPGSVALGSGNVYVAELAGAGEFDQLLVGGTLTLGGLLKLVELPGLPLRLGDSLQLFGSGTLLGQFDNIDTTAAPLGAGLAWDFSQLSSRGQITVTAVPEPATWALWLVALGVVAQRVRVGQTRLAATRKGGHF